MIEFTDQRGWERTGEVWSPGPVARSVWVLITDEDGEQVAVPVKLGTTNAPARQIEHWFNSANFSTHPHPEAQTAYVNDVKYAPQLSQKTWRELTADQIAGEQLELSA